MKKEVFKAEIAENKPIADKIYQMVIKAPQITDNYWPGQFINVYLDDKSMLLPRPVSISSVSEDTVTLIYKVVGKGTEEMASKGPGELVRLSTNLGNGFRLEDVFNEIKGTSSVVALVGGGMGIAPLVGLARLLAKEKKVRGLNDEDLKIVAFVGFQDEPVLLETLEDSCNRVYFSTESGAKGFKGNVIQLIKKTGIKVDYYIACGPKPMLKTLAQICKNTSIPLQVSLEERMGCGYGACVGCVSKTKEKETSKFKMKKVCADGPVFFGSEVVWDD
ncbi:MAG TPA: dihydroorotate dehydrogenase electron transfer subunit [Clostridiales bacterium]|jgi:dihydroorotate dehydrogenase electron transfer subunit|nr:dihydroorotate dehydrogenase electron transfer subunit [Clostridiales bacterium]